MNFRIFSLKRQFFLDVLVVPKSFFHFNIGSFIQSFFQFNFRETIFTVKVNSGFQLGIGVENDFLDPVFIRKF